MMKRMRIKRTQVTIPRGLYGNKRKQNSPNDDFMMKERLIKKGLRDNYSNKMCIFAVDFALQPKQTITKCCTPFISFTDYASCSIS